MSKRRLGDVVEIALPRHRYAYGRVYRDATIGFYRERSGAPGQPPIGSRDFGTFVGVSDTAFRQMPVVGTDPFASDEDDWPPPAAIRDVITGQYSIYHRGTIRPSSIDEAAPLERAGVWELDHLVARLDRGN
jgi:hypothetical protein